jgi:predicted dehydrogenase
VKNEKVNIGIIGAGWIVEHAHIPALLDMDDVSIVAIFDIDIYRAQRLCTTFKIEHACNMIEEFFSLGLDGVIIATPNFSHVDYSLKALKHGIHVLCEKPVALHAEEVREIIDVGKKYNALYIPGFVNRWRQDIQNIYNVVYSGNIGDIKSIDAGWLRKIGVPRPGTWFTNKELSGGGVLVDLGSHVLDICLMLLGDRRPISYELTTSLYNNNKMKSTSPANWFKMDYSNKLPIDVEDTAYATINYNDGALLNVKLSWLAPIDGDCTYFNIVGTKGEINLKTLFGFSNEHLWQKESLKIECEGVKTIEQLDKKYNNSKNAFSKMLKYFIGAILNQKISFTSSADALKTVELIENLYAIEKVDSEAINRIILEEFKNE